MRLAYVCTDPGVPVFGSKGGSIHVQEVLRALLARGVEVVLFARRIGGEAPRGLESIKVRRLARAPSGQHEERERFLLSANAELDGLLRAEGGIDIVYERHALWSYSAMEFAAEQGVPGLLEVNAPLVEEQARFRKLFLADEAAAAAQRCFDSAGALLAVSRPLAAWLSDRTACPARVHVVPNGVDTSRFGPGIVPALPCADAVTLGFLGSLRPWHGVEQLVDGFLRLREEGLPVRLLVVGDGPMLESISEQCASAGDSAILTGSVDPDRVPGLLASMDIAVAPYPEMESFYFSPLKLYEYMAAGKAIVASAVGQIEEVIEHEVTGLLSEPDSSESLLDALRSLVIDPGLRRRLGESARSVALRKHSWAEVGGRILSLAASQQGVTL